MPELVLLGVVIAAAIGFGIVNGFNDAANSVAASIGSRAISPWNAIILAACFTFAGAATGLEVAKTVGKGILLPEAVLYETLFAGLAAVIIWVSLATRRGLPVSSTHSIVAGLAGAGIAMAGGVEAVQWRVMQPVLASVVTAPALGFVGGFALVLALLWATRRKAPARIRIVFSRLQWLTSAFLAYSLGKNNGQMPIGLIAMALVIFYEHTGQSAQAAAVWDEIALGRGLWWVIIVSSLAISAGTAIGGWQVIRTVGFRITALQPIHGFATDFAAATVIEMASRLGIPVSSTHCVSAGVMGVGATRRLSAVRWGVTRNIVLAWILTFPVCGALGWAIASALKVIF
ncbi:MAG: inorganic phosphate transporter [Dehalococcoidia bacterium]|nr:inorganic phosphate transporter [Dehalococcoidia bacterium]